jgi:hypothetical protein
MMEQRDSRRKCNSDALDNTMTCITTERTELVLDMLNTTGDVL